MADCYSTAAQSGAVRTRALCQARRPARSHGQGRPGQPARRLHRFPRNVHRLCRPSSSAAKPDAIGKLQDDWRDKLKAFVETYPTADDAPDAILQLGMVGEFAGKEDEAKTWYQMLVQKHPKSTLAPKAQGAVRRLSVRRPAIPTERGDD